MLMITYPTSNTPKITPPLITAAPETIPVNAGNMQHTIPKTAKLKAIPNE